MMLDNVSYNKIKMLHKMSQLSWFIHHHALADAKAAGDMACLELLAQLERDLKKYIEKMQKSMCVISQ